ncbi:hypothetical protein BGX29_006851 [Mortierella sp. GBA35]|nr:hypothetical protein BGX29_006851 [Mortierella sp. GBA35]
MAAIQTGRYKIWRSPVQLLVSMNGPNSLAILGHAESLESPDSGIWIIEASSSNDDGSTSTATIKNESSQAYLAPDSQSDLVGRGSTLYVQDNNRQTWTISPAGSGSADEFHIQYPTEVEGQTLVVDNSFLRAYPPRLALQALGAFPDADRPWRFELLD